VCVEPIRLDGQAPVAPEKIDAVGGAVVQRDDGVYLRPRQARADHEFQELVLQLRVRGSDGEVAQHGV